MTYEEMQAKLKSRLKPGRYEHSLGVAETAAFLARRFQADEEKARIAGLLHDCARQYPNEQLASEAERRGIRIGQVERAMPLLLHAYIGASLIREEYGIDDEELAHIDEAVDVAEEKEQDQPPDKTGTEVIPLGCLRVHLHIETQTEQKRENGIRLAGKEEIHIFNGFSNKHKRT